MQNFFERMIGQLTAEKVEFVIVGGVSAVLQGVTIVTKDVDLCYRRSPQNIARLAGVLTPLSPRLRGFPSNLPFTFDERALNFGSNFTLLIDNESLDLLGEMSGLGGYEQIIEHALDMEVAGVHVKVLSLAQLIVTKKAAGRAKDLAALPLLESALKGNPQE